MNMRLFCTVVNLSYQESRCQGRSPKAADTANLDSIPIHMPHDRSEMFTIAGKPLMHSIRIPIQPHGIGSVPVTHSRRLLIDGWRCGTRTV